MGLGLGLSITGGSYISFLPTDISNLALWLQNGVGITSDESNQVSKWEDSSGNDNHVTQGTAGRQADLSDGGLDFEEGQQDHYDLTSTITIAENQGFCVAIVMDTETSTNNFIFSKDANDQLQITNAQTFTVKTNDPSDIVTEIVCPTATFGNQKQLILVNRSAGANNRFTFFKNGVALTADTDTSSNEDAGENPGGIEFTVLGSRTGGSNFFDGIIHEAAIWSKGLSTQEIADVNSYLQSIHGL